MGATAILASEEQSHHALQDYPPGSGDTYSTSIGNKYQSNLRTQANNIRQITIRVDVYNFSFMPSTITAWNRLPPEARAAPSVDSFRQAIQNFEPANRLNLAGY